MITLVEGKDWTS